MMAICFRTRGTACNSSLAGQTRGKLTQAACVRFIAKVGSQENGNYSLKICFNGCARCHIKLNRFESNLRAYTNVCVAK